MDLIDIYRTFHPNTTEYTLFSSAHGTFSRIDHILGPNQALVNLRKLKSYQVSFLTTCYETRYQLQEKVSKKYRHMNLKNTLLNNQEITGEIKEEIKKISRNK